MIKNLLFILIIAVFVGCQAHPRYRTGGEERPGKVKNLDKTRTTNDKLKLGLILQSYLGKPYKGKSKYEEGLDCSHFTRSVYKKYARIKIPRMARDQFKSGREINYKYLKYGDMVFFKTDGKSISHVGIYLDDRDFIHVSTSRGVIISSLRENYWSNSYAGARRIIE